MKNIPYPLYDVMEIKNLKELVSKCADTFGEKIAFRFEREKEEVCISYSQFKSDVDALGTALTESKITNVKIALLGENSYEWILTYFAVVCSANVIVPLDKELTASDSKKILDDCGAVALIFSDGYSDISDFLKENNSDIEHYINMKSIPGMLEKGEKLIQQGKKSVVEEMPEDNALSTLSYTSGTTGSAKGVMLSHNNLASGIIAACRNVFIPERSILVLPLHHASGFTGLSCMLVYGSEVAINLSLKNLSDDLIKYRPGFTVLVPLFLETFYKKIWDGAKKQGKDNLLRKLVKISNILLKIGVDARGVFFKSIHSNFGGNLTYILSGGAPLDGKLVNGFFELGITLINAYGLTETVGIVSANRNNYFRAGSVGLAISCCEVKFSNVDDNGHGEICVKGENVFSRYYKDKKTTADSFDGDWFKTGDIGYMDNDGFLHISGRKKNVIILSSGKNVYPEEIEFELQGIPMLKEVVVRGNTSIHESTDLIEAEIFPDFESANAKGIDDIQVHFNNAISIYNKKAASFKRIHRVIIRDKEFPKTTTRKIKRNIEG